MFEIIILFILVELFEVYWQRSGTLLEALSKGFYFYNKSIFLLLFMHLGYLYTIYIMLAFSIYNWAIGVILALKTLDIIVKINLIDRVFVKRNIGMELEMMLESKTSIWIYLTGVFTYPYLLYLALSIHLA